MKTQTFNPELEATLQYVPDFQSSVFTITGLGEQLVPLAEEIQAAEAQPVKSPAQTAVKAAVTSFEPKEQYLNLGNLEPRQEARMALKALAWDIKTLGRNNEYRRFKERVAAEKALAMDMELGLVQSVHCRLHERMLDKTKAV
jgi:hypothetical protein